MNALSPGMVQRELALGGEQGFWARAYVSGIATGLSEANVDAQFSTARALSCPPNDLSMTSDQLIFSISHSCKSTNHFLSIN